ncbi:glycosyltransferase family 2 protein [Fibrobacterota bacterium]
MENNNDPIALSLIIPLYNEKDNVAPLFDKLKHFRLSFRGSVEVLLINDGSGDGTKEALEEAVVGQPEFVCSHFRVNLGKSACYNLGFSKARGRHIATMDGDLQDDPMDLIAMAEQLKGSADFISGWKHKGKSVFYKTVFSKFFNLFVRINTGVKVHDINCPIRIFKRECVENIYLHGEMFRFLPLLVSYLGFSVKECKVNNLPRLSGSTKFGLRRYSQAFFDFFTVIFLHRFKQKPMHFFGPIGMLLLLTGVGIDGFLVVRGLFFTDTGRIGHFAMLGFGVMLILIGLQIILFGFMTTLITETNKKGYHAYLEDDTP